MKTNYKWLVLIAVLMMGGVETSAQNSWEWGYGQEFNTLTITTAITDTYSGYSTQYEGKNYTGAYKLSSTQKISFTIPQIGEETYYNVTIAMFLKDKETYGGAEKLNHYFGTEGSKDDTSYDMDVPEELQGVPIDGKTHYATLNIWNITSGEYHLTKGGAKEVGVFYIKVEQVDDSKSMNALPQTGYKPRLWESFNIDGIKLYLGGWKYQSDSRLVRRYKGITSKYITNSNKEQSDSWDAASRPYSVGNEDPYYSTKGGTKTPAFPGFSYYSYAIENGLNEFIEPGYNGNYEFAKKYDDAKGQGYYGADERAEGNPFTVPAFGDFIKIEPECNGVVTLYVMQNGTIEWDARSERADGYQKGALTSNVAWRPVYIVDERGIRFSDNEVTATTNTEFTIGREDTEAYVFNYDYDDNDDSKDKAMVYCRRKDNGEIVTKYYYDKSLKAGNYHEDTNGDYVYLSESDKNNDNRTYVERITYKELVENSSHYNFFKNNFNGTAVWPASVRNGDKNETEQVWGPQYTGDGWIVICKGYVQYKFPVKAGKSYYVFANNTKLGFCGYEFEKNDNYTGSLTLDETQDYSLPSTTTTYASVTLSRTFNAGWNAICLPFSVTESKMREWFGSDGQTEDYELVTYNGAAYEGSKLIAHFFHHVYQDIIAGYPYMLWIPSGAKAIGNTVKFDNVTIEADTKVLSSFNTSHDYMPNGVSSLYDIATENDYIFNGFYSPKALQKGSYIVTNETYDTSRGEFQGGLQLYDGADAPSAKMKGFRSVLEPNGGASTAKEMVRISGTNFTNILDEVGADWQDATVINDIAEEMGFFSRPSNVYSVSGQLVRQNSTSLVGLPKGIYIVNGKKYFVN